MALISSAQAQPKIVPSPQQAAFLNALLGSKDNIALVARAGCGKTTTILMAVRAFHKAHPRSKIAVCCYNRDIKAEIDGKLRAEGFDWRDVQASTVHGLGVGLVNFAFSKPTIDGYKVRTICRSLENDRPIYRSHTAQISKLISLAKQAAFGFFPELQVSNTAAWLKLASHFGVDDLDDTSLLGEVVSAAQVVFQHSLDTTNVIDYDDMILFPLVKKLTTKFTKDLIFVDEAQDLSRARQALIKKFLTPAGGRMVIVGDDRQAIYGFSGADADALPNMIADYDATVLPLTVTRRCPKTVVEFAQKLVPDFEAHDDAPDGVVEHLDDFPSLVPGSDAILCRNNAPLVSIAYDLLRRKIPAKVLGRDIGQNLIHLCRKWPLESASDLSDRLRHWLDQEVQTAIAKDRAEEAEVVIDRVETIQCVIHQCAKDNLHTVDDVVRFIESVFPKSDKDDEAQETENVVILSSYHKSKGREWPRVYLYEHAKRCPSRWARKPWEQAQEANLAYVAITRAKSYLGFVTPKAEGED